MVGAASWRRASDARVQSRTRYRHALSEMHTAPGDVRALDLAQRERERFVFGLLIALIG